MTNALTPTIRARRPRERRSRGVVIVAPVEIGMDGVELLVDNGLLKQFLSMTCERYYKSLKGVQNYLRFTDGW